MNLKDVNFSCEEGSSGCADFSESWLVRTDFSGSKLRGANFSFSDLRDSHFISADLSNSDFSFAELEGMQFRELIPILLRVSLDEGERRPDIVPGLTEGMFRELLKVGSPVRGMDEKVRVMRWEFALERFSISPGLADLLNTLTNAANLEGAKFSFFGMNGRHGRLEFEGYKSIDLYTRIPLGLAVPQSKDEADIYDRLDKIQLKADDLFGLYEVNIDLGSDFPGTHGDDVTCSRSGSFSSLGVSLGDYEKMAPNEQREFITGLCALGSSRMRGSLPFP